MSDNAKDRSKTMRAIKSRDTKPELIVRRIIHRAGYRYRLHRADLPGKPDLVFTPRRKAIFIHGCFWHGHDCRRGARTPKTNQAYWINKISRNKERDYRVQKALKELGWNVLIIWECQIKNPDNVFEKITGFLG